MDGFFTTDDPTITKVIYELTLPVWWSRIYEYKFVIDKVNEMAFLSPSVSDLACGLPHPLKVFLSDKCSLFACDIGDLSYKSIQESKKDWFPNEPDYDEKLLDKITFDQCNIESLPYENEQFDLMYCVSVLEHTSMETQKKALQEAYRCLKVGGTFLVTVDYPDVNLDYIYSIADSCGFKYNRPDNLKLPNKAINSVIHGGLKCYHFEFTK